jgi:H+/gluconate symporter-like permease
MNAEWEFLAMLKEEGRRSAGLFLQSMARIWENARPTISLHCWRSVEDHDGSRTGRYSVRPRAADLLPIAGGAYFLLAPVAATIAALFSHEPVLAHWTQTFMGSAAGFFAQFFPLFLLGALFGTLMEDSGSVGAIASFMTYRLGSQRAVLAVVCAGALVTYPVSAASRFVATGGPLVSLAVIGSGTLDSLPHNGAVVTLLSVCGSTHHESYPDIVIVGIVGPIIALAAIIILGSSFGSF